jgi:hypothetical protein
MSVSIAIRKTHIDDAEEIRACLESVFEPFRSCFTVGAFQGTVLSLAALRERMLHMTVYAATLPNGQIVGTIAAAAHGEETEHLL